MTQFIKLQPTRENSGLSKSAHMLRVLRVWVEYSTHVYTTGNICLNYLL